MILLQIKSIQRPKQDNHCNILRTILLPPPNRLQNAKRKVVGAWQSLLIGKSTVITKLLSVKVQLACKGLCIHLCLQLLGKMKGLNIQLQSQLEGSRGFYMQDHHVTLGALAKD